MTPTALGPNPFSHGPCCLCHPGDRRESYPRGLPAPSLIPALPGNEACLKGCICLALAKSQRWNGFCPPGWANSPDSEQGPQNKEGLTQPK